MGQGTIDGRRARVLQRQDDHPAAVRAAGERQDTARGGVAGICCAQLEGENRERAARRREEEGREAQRQQRQRQRQEEEEALFAQTPHNPR